ncbi:hypothetical protein RSOLAG1IB_09546 [Rhizoctonia solani AG-1 IB]|uniref:Uncharacterized protein n=1 Tax=Thanatephorus cucumeris (strain AG1-IB / isolate 7/3/14) TaxID=1108050 RepID=A0A0B7FVQ6_THACB|nr:hypothetical protein RSOLAG1IB_09546 [Rhizoctonia solani AG-1 IB]
MSHSYTPRTSVFIGLVYSIVPEFMHGSHSEGETPLVTPIHTDFSDTSNLIGCSRLTTNEYARLDEYFLEECEHDCPPAPRVDNGSFDYKFACEYGPSSELGTSIDYSVNNSASDHSDVLSKALTHQPHLFGPEDLESLRVQVRRVHRILPFEGPNTLEDRCYIWTIPYAPRPDTGSWLSDSENVVPITHGTFPPDAKPTLHHYPHLESFAQSAFAKPILPKYSAPIIEANATKQPTLDGSPTRVVKWNLGLGLTLDDIDEPDGCGTEIGEASVEFAECSFFDSEIDFQFCSTADTTLNTTTETIPDLLTNSQDGVLVERNLKCVAT